MSCIEVKRRAEAKAAVIIEKIRTLHMMKETLTKLAATYSGRGPNESELRVTGLGQELWFGGWTPR
jgi:hypothetical protein